MGNPYKIKVINQIPITNDRYMKLPKEQFNHNFNKPDNLLTAVTFIHTFTEEVQCEEGT